MVCVFKHLYCSAQLSMSNMEKRYRNKIIIIIIKYLIFFWGQSASAVQRLNSLWCSKCSSTGIVGCDLTSLEKQNRM